MSKQTTFISLELGIVLFIIFLVMKLTYNIDWSWWWVTSPLWLLLAIFGVIALVWLFVVLLTAAVIAKSDRKK